MSIAINTITAICLALLTLEVGYVVVNTIIKKRADRIAFIRGFKKGKCIAIFLTAIPLMFLGYWYASDNIFESILSAISHVFGLVVLDFGLGDIYDLISDNLFYKLTVYYCCVLVTINAVLFALSLLGQRLWQGVQALKVRLTTKDKLYIFGCNKNSLSIYRSEKTRKGVIVDNISDSDRSSMYINKISFISTQRLDGVIDSIFSCIGKRNNKITVVINTEDDVKNLELGRKFTLRISEADEAFKARLFDRLDIHIFGDPKYQAIYEEIVASSYGCVHYKNKYRMIAMSFVEQYPLTRFMDERHIDYKTALLKDEVNVNVCMVGFGKPNQQIFLTSIANNQFLAENNGVIGLKQVNYHIFDKTFAENNKGLNHSYYRFRNEGAKIKPEEYLPLPELPAREMYYHVDINEPIFYTQIREAVSKKTDASFIIISFENDLENIDLAQKLVAKSREWGLDNLTIFVRVRSRHSYKALFEDKNVYLIGGEEENVYNIAEITADKIFQMSQMRNEIYSLEYKKTADKSFVVDRAAILENREQAKRAWYLSKSQLERESNLYCCLSLQSKLNLIGLRYCRVEENDLPALTEQEYMECYADKDKIEIVANFDVEGKKVVNYTLDFPESKRKNLAVLEHLRWNSFMISQGMVPAKKEQILNETVEKNGKMVHTNGKNYSLRRHGNLTTFDGLITFRKMLSERDGGDEKDYDVIKYDYQLLDDAYWLLTQTGCKIVKR